MDIMADAGGSGTDAGRRELVPIRGLIGNDPKRGNWAARSANPMTLPGVLADERTGAIVLFFRGRYLRAQMLRRDTINTRYGAIDNHGILSFDGSRRDLAIHEVAIERIEAALFRIAIAPSAGKSEPYKIIGL